MSVLCYKKCGAAPPLPSDGIDPNDGTWLWVTADTTGAVDASGAIDSAINAAAQQNKNVYIPAGTYKLSTGFGAPSNDGNYADMKIAGAGIDKTKFVVPNNLADTALFWYRIAGVHLSDFWLYTAPPSGVQAVPSGIYFAGMQDSSIRRVRIENFKDALRLAGVYDNEPPARRLLIEDVITRGSTNLSFQVICTEDSIFRRLDLENTVNGGSGMCIYDERRNKNNLYEDIICTGGYRSCWQFSNDYPSGLSSDITVRNATLNMPANIHDNYALTFASVYEAARHERIWIYDLKINVTPSNTECIRWYGWCNDVVIDGIAAVGGKCLNAGYDNNAEVSNCQVKNGTYKGANLTYRYQAGANQLVPGLTVSNITLI